MQQEDDGMVGAGDAAPYFKSLLKKQKLVCVNSKILGDSLGRIPAKSGVLTTVFVEKSI